MTEVRTRRAAVVLAGLLVVLMSALLAGHAFAQQDPTDQTDTTDTVDTGDSGDGGGTARTFAVVAQPQGAVAPGAVAPGAAPALAAVPQGVAPAPAPMAAAPVPAAAPAAAPVPAAAPAAPAATTATTVRTVTRAAAPARRLGRTGSSTSTELLVSGLAFLFGGVLLLAASPLRRAQRQLICPSPLEGGRRRRRTRNRVVAWLAE